MNLMETCETITVTSELHGHVYMYNYYSSGTVVLKQLNTLLPSPSKTHTHMCTHTCTHAYTCALHTQSLYVAFIYYLLKTFAIIYSFVVVENQTDKITVLILPPQYINMLIRQNVGSYRLTIK